MSASLDRLKAAVTAVESKVLDLETRPPAGTPDAELDALSNRLEALVSPTTPAPAPDPSAATAAASGGSI